MSSWTPHGAMFDGVDVVIVTKIVEIRILLADSNASSNVSLGPLSEIL